MKNKKGFTLVELIIVITIVGIIAGVVGYILLATVQGWTFKTNRNDLLSDGRLAMNRMVREIREIKDLTGVITANASQLRFLDIGDLDITYSLSGIDLNRTENGTTNILASSVSGLSFSYYDNGGNTVASPLVSPSSTDIRRVRLNMTLTKNGENVYLQSDSTPRNF